ncbi:MAG: hypothetical protein ACJ71I_14430 [Nitrososphaeraceae archaeon]
MVRLYSARFNGNIEKVIVDLAGPEGLGRKTSKIETQCNWRGVRWNPE